MLFVYFIHFSLKPNNNFEFDKPAYRIPFGWIGALEIVNINKMLLRAKFYLYISKIPLSFILISF